MRKSWFIENFKVGLTGIANVVDPELILLGGGVADGLIPYLPDILSHVQKHAFPAVGASIQIKLTKYKNLSGALGAALLAKDL